MGMEHERIHLETSSVLMRELPAALLRRPAAWPAYHASVAQAQRMPPPNELLEGARGGAGPAWEARGLRSSGRRRAAAAQRAAGGCAGRIKRGAQARGAARPAVGAAPPACTRPPATLGPPSPAPHGAVPAGEVTLGKPADWPTYGWDNEYGRRSFSVRAFRASRQLVRCACKGRGPGALPPGGLLRQRLPD